MAPLSMGFFQARILEWVDIFLLQGIFPTQGSTPYLLCFLHCRWILYLVSHQGREVCGVCVCVCVCVCVYTHTHMYMYIHTHVCVYTYTYVYVYTYTCMCVCMWRAKPGKGPFLSFSCWMYWYVCAYKIQIDFLAEDLSLEKHLLYSY